MVAVRRAVKGRSALTFIEFPVANKPPFISQELPAHKFLDFRCAAGFIPEAYLVDQPVEEIVIVGQALPTDDVHDAPVVVARPVTLGTVGYDSLLAIPIRHDGPGASTFPHKSDMVPGPVVDIVPYVHISP